MQTTVNKLAEQGVRVRCLALGGVDLTTPAGKTMVIEAVAQFEKDLRGLPLQRRPRWTFRFTPTPGLWLSAVKNMSAAAEPSRSSPRA